MRSLLAHHIQLHSLPGSQAAGGILVEHTRLEGGNQVVGDTQAAGGNPVAGDTLAVGDTRLEDIHLGDIRLDFDTLCCNSAGL